jgi:hypothetical protein
MQHSLTNNTIYEIYSLCWEKSIVKWLIFHVLLLLEFWSMILAKIYLVDYDMTCEVDDLHVEKNIVNAS